MQYLCNCPIIQSCNHTAESGCRRRRTHYKSYSSWRSVGRPDWAFFHKSRYCGCTQGFNLSANSNGRLKRVMRSCTSAKSRSRWGALIPEASFNSSSVSSVTTRIPSISSATPGAVGSGKTTGLGNPSPGYSPAVIISIRTPVSVSRKVFSAPLKTGRYPRPTNCWRGPRQMRCAYMGSYFPSSVKRKMGQF